MSVADARRRVFLVEDDSWIRTFMRDILNDEGYFVREAADGRTALRMVYEEKQLPDVILLDLAMPEFSGLEVLRELKRDRRTRRVPVIVLSSYRRVLSTTDEGLVAGVLDKPLVVEKLLEQIRRIMGEPTSGRS